jgi:head-tail adaptor
MDIGKLDRYVRIEQVTITNDPDYGTPINTWTTYKNAWAKITDITGKSQESTKSDLRLMKRPCEVTMRFDAGINSTMRLVMLDRDDRVLQIVSKPAELGRREGIMFMCEDYAV